MEIPFFFFKTNECFGCLFDPNKLYSLKIGLHLEDNSWIYQKGYTWPGSEKVIFTGTFSLVVRSTKNSSDLRSCLMFHEISKELVTMRWYFPNSPSQMLEELIDVNITSYPSNSDPNFMYWV